MENVVTDLLKIRYPVIQAPMLGISTPEMAAVVSNGGGLGSIAAGGLSPENTYRLIRAVKQLTDKPFAVNLFVHPQPDFFETDLRAMHLFLLQLAAKKGYAIPEALPESFTFHSYKEQLEILIREQVAVVSFTFGCLSRQEIRELREAGCRVIGTATCAEEAGILEEVGCDMITAQGIEAGGHRGTFLEHIPLPQMGLFSLLSQILARVSIPVIAAGGIYDENTCRAARMLGAAGVQAGTAFIGTSESVAIPSYKQRLMQVTGNCTTLTRSFTGRWARGIRNPLMELIEESGIPPLPYPIQNSLTAPLRRAAQQADDWEFTNLWAGQSVGRTSYATSEEVLAGLAAAWQE